MDAPEVAFADPEVDERIDGAVERAVAEGVSVHPDRDAAEDGIELRRGNRQRSGKKLPAVKRHLGTSPA
jgi:hypothetical protein